MGAVLLTTPECFVTRAAKRRRKLDLSLFHTLRSLGLRQLRRYVDRATKMPADAEVWSFSESDVVAFGRIEADGQCRASVLAQHHPSGHICTSHS
eukprot:1187322-Prorocentrum_minimum.AAC.2